MIGLATIDSISICWQLESLYLSGIESDIWMNLPKSGMNLQTALDLWEKVYRIHQVAQKKGVANRTKRLTIESNFIGTDLRNRVKPNWIKAKSDQPPCKSTGMQTQSQLWKKRVWRVLKKSVDKLGWGWYACVCKVSGKSLTDFCLYKRRCKLTAE